MMNWRYHFKGWRIGKLKKGIVSTIKTVSWIIQNYPGCDTQEKIRHFIQDAYLKWGTEYVLIGGDVNIVPVRVNSGQTTEDIPIITDLYYSAIYPISNNWNANGNNKFGEIYPMHLIGTTWYEADESDYTADIWVGRAPVHNGGEVNLFINKIFTYERNSLAPNIPGLSYLMKMLNLAGIAYEYNWNN